MQRKEDLRPEEVHESSEAEAAAEQTESKEPTTPAGRDEFLQQVFELAEIEEAKERELDEIGVSIPYLEMVRKSRGPRFFFEAVNNDLVKSQLKTAGLAAVNVLSLGAAALSEIYGKKLLALASLSLAIYSLVEMGMHASKDFGAKLDRSDEFDVSKLAQKEEELSQPSARFVLR